MEEKKAQWSVSKARIIWNDSEQAMYKGRNGLFLPEKDEGHDRANKKSGSRRSGMPANPLTPPSQGEDSQQQ